MSNDIKHQIKENYLSWKNSFIAGVSLDSEGAPLPWITYKAIGFLENYLQSTHTIFEFGLGTSTLFFANRVKRVVSIESRQKWANIIKNRASDTQKSKITVQIVQDPHFDDSYEKSVQKFCDSSKEKFDLILIDSLKRHACIQNSVYAVKDNGYIILDDSERKGYVKSFSFLANLGFECINFDGIAPGGTKIKRTSFFTKRNKN